MTTCPAPSLRIRVAKAAPTSETNDSSISEPTRPRTSYALITRWTAAADRDIKGLLTVVAFRRQPSRATMRIGSPAVGVPSAAHQRGDQPLLVEGVGQHAKVTAATPVTGRALASRGQD